MDSILPITSITWKQDGTTTMCAFKRFKLSEAASTDLCDNSQPKDNVSRLCCKYLDEYMMNNVNVTPLVLCTRPKGPIHALLGDICDEEEEDENGTLSQCHNVSSSTPGNLGQADTLAFDGGGGLGDEIIQALVWFFAITAIMGNMFVFVQSAMNAWRRFSKMSGPEKVHAWLVANLALSDSMMGLYLTMYGIQHANESQSESYNEHERYEWLSSYTCLAMGVISFCSSQVSASLLAVITCFRLYSTLRPFAPQSGQFRRAIIASACCWLFWISYAIIPIANTEWSNRIYMNFIKLHSTFCSKEANEMHFNFYQLIVRRSSEFIHNNCGPTIGTEFIISDQPTWGELNRASRTLGIIDYSDPMYFGYFNERSVCTGNYFTVFGARNMPYTFFVLVYNIINFAFIMIAYVRIFHQATPDNDKKEAARRRKQQRDKDGVRIWRRASSHFRRRSTRSRSSISSKTSKSSVVQKRENENRRMQIRITIVILTDFLCWVPLCLMGIYFTLMTGTMQEHSCEFHEYVNYWQQVFATITLIIIPINSSLNPFIYSARFWSVAKRRASKKWKRRPSYLMRMKKSEDESGVQEVTSSSSRV